MKIEVRPVESNPWHGKKGKESFSRPKTLQALVDPVTMEYATGLTDEDIKKLEDKGVSYDLSPSFDPEKPHPFWDGTLAQIKMQNATMIFDTDKTLDFIKVAIMKASKYVANSVREYDEGLFPDATHIMIDERQEIEKKASKVSMRNKALLEIEKLPRSRKLQLAMIVEGKDLKKSSEDTLVVVMDEMVEKKTQEVLKFLKMDPEETANHALVLEAVQKGILRKKGYKIFYHDSVIGNDVYDVVNYITDPENQDFKIRIMSAIN